MARRRNGFVCINSSKTSTTTISLIGLFVVGLIYYKLSFHNFSWYNNKTNVPCKIPNKEMADLKVLAKDTSDVLTRLNVSHFLVYGSLWGGLRFNGPLPWDNDFDLGVLYQEINKYSEQDIKDHFKPYNIDCYYSYRFGFYRVTRGSARGDIMIYRDFYNTQWLHRTGWEAYVFFINYRNFHSFPAHLVKTPLDSTKFGILNISIPHNGVEIQRYHYPYDWWTVGKPRGC